MSSCIFSFLTFCLNMKPPTEPNGRQIIVAVVQPDYFINAKYYSSNFKKRHLFSLIFLCRSKNNNLPSFIQFFNSQLFKTQQNLIVKEIDVTAPKRAHLEQYFYPFFISKPKKPLLTNIQAMVRRTINFSVFQSLEAKTAFYADSHLRVSL